MILDHSASTRRHGALAQAKGLLADWFEQAYRQRVRVAVLQTAGDRPEWSFQGQRSGQALQAWLEQLGAGGGTPLLAGLAEAQAWLKSRRRQRPGEECQLLLVTDGRLRQRVAEGSLLAVHGPDGRALRVPVFQLTATGELPGLRTILKAMRRDLKPIQVAAFFTTPQADLEDAEGAPMTPVAWLIAGNDPSAVRELAQAL